VGLGSEGKGSTTGNQRSVKWGKEKQIEILGVAELGSFGSFPNDYLHLTLIAKVPHV